MLRWRLFPTAITLPGGRRYERCAYLSWRTRLSLWIALAAAGRWVLGWSGIAVGLAAGILAEMVLSYRGPQSRAPSRPHPGESAGVREPLRPRPTGGAGGMQHAIDPIPTEMD